MSYEPLHHKYRPQTFADLVGQEVIATTLTNAITSGKIAPAYLLTGPRGTGKTSSARILAKSLNCLSSEHPTPIPCGKCEVCRAIARSSALDVIEMDAASNTGVDNIREIIERAQFAPVQCRYKVYVIDECLTGNSLVLTLDGLMRIDEPNLKGKMVLSYNDKTGFWEYKKVLRWLEREIKQTLVIQTTNREIRCTSNHLIRTEQGWIHAKDVKEGMKILSPVNMEAYQWLTSLETVESVQIAEVERVYDIEVEDNHNFVANGLLVHNCHMLSTAAFNALLKTLEEPPDRVIFVLATTDPQRVLPTVISRCQRFDYRRISLEAMVTHLSKIANLENININPEAIILVAQIANGGLRDAESLLDQLSLLTGTITPEKVWELVGSVPEQDLMSLLKTIRLNVPDAVIEQCRHLLNRGKEPLVVLQNLAGFYLNLLLAKTAPQRPDMVAVTAPTWQELCTEAQYWSLNDILQGQQHLKNSEVQLKNTTQKSLWLEVTLLGLLPLSAPSQTPPPKATVINTIEPSPPSPVKPVAIPTTPNIKPDVKPVAIPTTPNIKPDVKLVAIPTTPNIKPEENKPEEKVIPIDKSQEDSGNIWERVINELQANTTQTILKQHCSLLSFNGSVAYIEVPSEYYLKLLRQRLASIESTFEAICQRKVKVNLQLVSLSESSDIMTGRKPYASKSPVLSDSITDSTPYDSTPQTLADNNGTKVNPSEVESLTETLPISSVNSLENQHSEDEIIKAAESLAKCFEGEIISMDHKVITTEVVSTPVKDVQTSGGENHKNLSHKLIVRGRTDPNTIDDDDDIPF